MNNEEFEHHETLESPDRNFSQGHAFDFIRWYPRGDERGAQADPQEAESQEKELPLLGRKVRKGGLFSRPMLARRWSTASLFLPERPRPPATPTFTLTRSSKSTQTIHQSLMKIRFINSVFL